MKTVVIASHNPVKIRAAKNGFEAAFPGQVFELRSVSVASGVADQPMSDAETLQGAENRAAEAEKQCPASSRQAGTCFWVGMEGGLAPENHSDDSPLMAFAWVVVRAGEISGRSRTATFTLPKKITGLVKAGQELGEADDLVFGQTESKKKGGAVGLLTGDIIDRARLYEPSVILALIPFLNPDLYPTGQPQDDDHQNGVGR